MLMSIEVNNKTSSLKQLSHSGGIQFLGSAKGVLPIGILVDVDLVGA